MEKIKLDRPVIVEGKYDKIKLYSILDADIITTEGFGIFKGQEKTRAIRRIAQKNGIIVLTDSDGAGLVIRNYFNSVLDKSKITHLYIPEIKGREKRKTGYSKAGTLGVEGIDADILRSIFAPFSVGCSTEQKKRAITKNDFYEDGFSGKDRSTEKRAVLCQKAGLPRNLSANALLGALNLLYTYEEYSELKKDI